MNRLFGKTERFKLINTTGNRTVVSYDRQDVDEENSTWREVSFSKDHSEKPSIEQIRKAIIADIGARTDYRSEFGYTWQGKPVRLNRENRDNFKAVHDAAAMYPDKVKFPRLFKLSEDGEGMPVYHEFQSMEELAQFYLGGLDWIDGCVHDGFVEKDSFDFTPYEQELSK